MDNNIDPKVGEVWLVDLSNATGHQQRGIRPFVVTSNNKRNFFSPTIKGNPLSSRIYKRSPVHVLLSKEDCDFLEVDSIVLCEETDTLNKGQFIKKLGVMQSVQKRGYYENTAKLFTAEDNLFYGWMREQREKDQESFCKKGIIQLRNEFYASQQKS